MTHRSAASTRKFLRRILTGLSLWASGTSLHNRPTPLAQPSATWTFWTSGAYFNTLKVRVLGTEFPIDLLDAFLPDDSGVRYYEFTQSSDQRLMSRLGSCVSVASTSALWNFSMPAKSAACLASRSVRR